VQGSATEAALIDAASYSSFALAIRAVVQWSPLEESVMASRAEEEVDRNFDYFQRHIADYLPAHEGRYALLHRCQAVDFFDNLRDAEAAGVARFGRDDFSIQEVTSSVMDLGFYSHAHGQR
jgi:hypothetical protein